MTDLLVCSGLVPHSHKRGEGDACASDNKIEPTKTGGRVHLVTVDRDLALLSLSALRRGFVDITMRLEASSIIRFGDREERKRGSAI